MFQVDEKVSLRLHEKSEARDRIEEQNGWGTKEKDVLVMTEHK